MFDDKCRAFTLVEFLIVLSIVAILAMVAAPKMLESKLLSKLTQTYQDQRLLQNALDSYFMDYGEYPGDHHGYSLSGGFNQLTSPIRYLNKLMADPFREPNPFHPFYTYEGASGSDDRRYCPRGWMSMRCIHAYLIAGIGPDKKHGSTPMDFPYEFCNFISYSPTNGSESLGDILRLMGDYRRGEGSLDFMHFAWVGNSYPKGVIQK